jgi:hypothetical protein
VGTFEVDTWQKADKSAIFREAIAPDEFIQGTLISYSISDDYASTMDYPTNYQDSPELFVGQRAIRLESVPTDKDEYHMEEYGMLIGFRPTFIGAGVKQSTWDTGGKETLEAILESVEFGTFGAPVSPEQRR